MNCCIMTFKIKLLRKIKRGFTLIELSITVMIIGILLSIEIYSINNFKRVNNTLTFDYYTNEIVVFFNCSENYCKANDISGEIYIDGNKIKFKCNNQLVRYISFPEYIDINYMNSDINKIVISRYGRMLSACTIAIKNLKEKNLNKSERKITIRVGTELIQIQKEE